jgi:curved DNA-binding protein CbpA
MAERSFRKPRPASLYEVLQVVPQAEPGVIQASYRVLARRYHPDVNQDPESAARMRELNAAYDVLGDPIRRAQYDAERAWAAGPRAPQHSSRASTVGSFSTVARPIAPAHAMTIRSAASPAFRARLVLVALALLGALTLLLWLLLEMLNEVPTPLLV